MTYGLQTFNQSNQVQIDGSFSALTIHSSGTAANNATLTIPSEAIIMGRPLTQGSLMAGVGNGTQFTILCSGGIEYVILIKIDSPSADDYGIQVFGESGNFIATSNKKVFVADGLYEAPFNGLTFPGTISGLAASEFGKRYVSIHNGVTALRQQSPSITGVIVSAITLSSDDLQISFGGISAGLIGGGLNLDFNINRGILTGYL